MTEQDVRKKVIDIIVAKLRVYVFFKEKDITDHSLLTDDLVMDSLDITELIMEYEKEFGVKIPDEEAEDIRTVGDAIKCICDKKHIESTITNSNTKRGKSTITLESIYCYRNGNSVYKHDLKFIYIKDAINTELDKTNQGNPPSSKPIITAELYFGKGNDCILATDPIIAPALNAMYTALYKINTGQIETPEDTAQEISKKHTLLQNLKNLFTQKKEPIIVRASFFYSEEKILPKNDPRVVYVMTTINKELDKINHRKKPESDYSIIVTDVYFKRGKESLLPHEKEVAPAMAAMYKALYEINSGNIGNTGR